MSQTLFQKKFDKESFTEFVRTFVSGFEIAESRAEELRIFKKVEQIGVSKKLDLVVFAIETNPKFNGRIEITKNTYAILKAHSMSHALVAFYSNDSTEWRLSLITTTVRRTAKGVKEDVSSPRRFSYVLGPNAKIVTPSKQLAGTVESIKELLNKFSLEVVNQDFYEDISRSFTELVGGTRNRVRHERLLNISGHHDEAYANFAIRLIGRLVFCWFLKQKKSITGGKALVSETILSSSSVGINSDYYHTILCPLFFEILNKPLTKRPEQLLNKNLFDSVPYLNGGLFSPHEDDKYKYDAELGTSSRGIVSIPDHWFKDFFAVLEKYNFTIDENTSVDTELSVDPEMLGRIFENLLAEVNPETGESARKATGSFYTPREIVEYMADESLITHLVIKTGIDEKKIRALNSYDTDDDSEYPLSREDAVQIVKALHHATVLDPACGSGAFPIGVLQKIVYMLGQADPKCEIYFNMQLEKAGPEFRRHMQKQFDNKNLNYIRKLGVIRECIHGIDIQPIATDISRLRCFLTLVVDQHVDDSSDNRGIEPLPNLDFKFMCANTLIQPSSQPSGGLFSDDFTDELSILVNEYFSPVDLVDKREIESKLRELITKKVNKERDSILDELLNNDFANNPKTREAYLEKNKESHDKRRADVTMWESYLNVFKNQKVDFFDTKYFFPAVYKSGGFDIVIGNPPYIRHRDLSKPLKDLLRDAYITGNTTSDIYCYFYELSHVILKNSGISSLITSNKWMMAKYGENLRKFLKAKSAILQIIDLGSGQFTSATVDTNIMIFRKQEPPIGHEVQYGFELPSQISPRLSLILQEQLNEDAFTLTDKASLMLIKKIESKGTALSEWNDLKINYGVLTGKNEIKTPNGNEGVFIIDEQTKNYIISRDNTSIKIIHPLLRGKDVARYSVNWSQKYIVAMHYGSHETVEGFPGVKDHLYKYQKELKSRAQVVRGDHHWIELDQNPSKNYLDEFSQPKIVYPEIASRASFTYDDKGYFHNNKVFHIVGNNLKFLVGVLNSKLAYWLIRNYGPSLGDSGFEFRKIFVEKIPVPQISNELQKNIVQLVDQILSMKQSDTAADVSEFEQRIDEIVYKLYDLTPEEINIIESSIK